MSLLIDFDLDCEALAKMHGETVKASQVYVSDDGGVEIIAAVSATPKLDEGVLGLITRAWERSLSEGQAFEANG